jgi:hypothetical protein
MRGEGKVVSRKTNAQTASTTHRWQCDLQANISAYTVTMLTSADWPSTATSEASCSYCSMLCESRNSGVRSEVDFLDNSVHR